ncbi:MAG: hypothetical protein J6W52_10245 [Bacteroidaceae bacterium]|nr:hypothetical protein [Bacteroidaceae bacterium]
MKQKLLIMCLCLFTGTIACADVKIDETNFPDANFRAWVLSQPYGADGVLKKKEIADVKKIEVSRLGIKNLKGIEYFTALEELYCGYNQIKGDDMDALIKYLPRINPSKLMENYNGTFHITNNSNLSNREVMNKFGVGNLYAIGSENEQNVMTAKQVSAAQAKGWTPFASNGFEWYKYAGARDQKAQGIVINEENFPDKIFRKCLIPFDIDADSVLSSNEILSVGLLNIAKRNIQSMKGIEYFTALKWLDCGGNQLTVLDLSKNTKLEGLDCSSNQLTLLDVSKNTALRELYCFKNQLPTLDVSKNDVLTELYCYTNQLTTLKVPKNSNLAKLYCHQNRIKDAAMDVLVENLPTVKSQNMSVIYYTGEQNVMTAVQVAAAKAKGWIPYYSDGSNWKEYAGSENPD